MSSEGGWLADRVSRVVAGVSFAAIPLSAVWLGVDLWLGRRQARMREGAAGA